MGWRQPDVGSLFSPALEELLGPARAADEPLDRRHRDIARSVQAMYEEAFFHLLDTPARALRARQPGARRRLRHEFGRQRQGGRDARHSSVSTSSPRRAMRAARSARRYRLAQGRRCCSPSPSDAPLCATSLTASARSSGDGPRLSGARIRLRTRSTTCLSSARETPDGSWLLGRARLPTRIACARRTAAAVARWEGGRLVPGSDGMGASRARQPLDPRRSAPRRHEGDPQPQDQAAGDLPPVRALGAQGACCRMVRGGRRCAVHDAGVPDPRREARARFRPSPTSTARAGCRRCIARPIRATSD